MKSAGGCGSHAQLRKKMPQHLDHMQLVTHILLQTTRKDNFYLILFFLGDHQVFRASKESAGMLCNRRSRDIRCMTILRNERNGRERDTLVSLLSLAFL